MDPYLEGYLWPDVHNELASALKALLVPVIAPKYVARIDLYTREDVSPETEVGIMYPDVELLLRSDVVREPGVGIDAVTKPTVVLAEIAPVEINIPVVEIRDAAQSRLITAIEILSPVNKKQPGLDAFRQKRRRLHDSGVHLLEIDLLRRGSRVLAHPHLPHTHYIASLWRAGTQQTDVWAFNWQDRLPVLPVPLAAPHADVALDLKKALDAIYARSRYDLSINYRSAPPPPAFPVAELQWMQTILPT